MEKVASQRQVLKRRTKRLAEEMADMRKSPENVGKDEQVEYNPSNPMAPPYYWIVSEENLFTKSRQW